MDAASLELYPWTLFPKQFSPNEAQAAIVWSLLVESRSEAESSWAPGEVSDQIQQLCTSLVGPQLVKVRHRKSALISHLDGGVESHDCLPIVVEFMVLENVKTQKNNVLAGTAINIFNFITNLNIC